MTTPRRPGRAARRGAGERGQSPVMAVLVLAAIAIVAAVVVTAKFAVATDQKGDARHAADAAALAGAQEVLDGIPDAVRPGFLLPSDIPVLLGGGTCLQTGRLQADRLARANDATLTSYCYDAYDDEISVSVSGPAGSRADATAATTFDASGCTVAPGFTPPTPGDDSGDDSDDPPPPPKPVRTTIDCGIADLVVTFDPVDSRFHFVGLELVLADVKPRLTR